MLFIRIEFLRRRIHAGTHVFIDLGQCEIYSNYGYIGAEWQYVSVGET